VKTIDPQRSNRYSYVANDPINRIDPSGRFIPPICDIASNQEYDVLGGIGASDANLEFGPYPDGPFCPLLLETAPLPTGGENCGENGCPPPENPVPPPPPSPPTCFAQLKYRPIEATLWFANHSFWWIQDETGLHHVISGGPSDFRLGKPGNVFGYLNVFQAIGDINLPEFPKDNSMRSTWFDSGTSTGVCYNADTMRFYADIYPNNSIPYILTGPNSNSLARFLGANSGFFPTMPPRAVGWGVPIP